MSQDGILRGVCECVAKVVDREPTLIRETDRLLEDLGADSLDLLDLLFQLEQRFRIRIKPRDIERRAQAALGHARLDEDGIYTPAALEQLRQAMPEVPAEELADGLRTSELPHRFRVATFVRLVQRLLEEQHGTGGPGDRR